MKMQQVQSKNITQVGYDVDEHVLRIIFSNGNTYEYAEVPEQIYRMFLTSQSKGAFFRDQIKFRYAYTKVC